MLSLVVMSQIRLQLAWSAVGRRSEPLLTSLLWVAGYSILFLAIAVWAYQRDETSKFV